MVIPGAVCIMYNVSLSLYHTSECISDPSLKARISGKFVKF